MKLYEIHNKLPPMKANWVVIAENKRGAYRFLGTIRRLTFGQWLWGGYRKFFHVSLGRRSATDTFQARSGTGTHEFSVTLEYVYEISEPRILVETHQTLEEYLFNPVRRRVQIVSNGFAFEDFKELEHALRTVFTPPKAEKSSWFSRRNSEGAARAESESQHFDEMFNQEKGAHSLGSFDILEIAVRVDPPPNLVVKDDFEVILANVNAQYLSALGRGDQDAANNYAKVREGIQQIQQEEREGRIDQATATLKLSVIGVDIENTRGKVDDVSEGVDDLALKTVRGFAPKQIDEKKTD